MRNARLLAVLALVASFLGLVFAAYSTYDYAQHLDRQIHAIHCSFIPGASGDTTAENPCKVALFSSYSALFRESYWGGVPISLFAVGAFSFFLGYALYLLLSGWRTPKRAYLFFGVTGLTPLCASLVMFVISLTRLHAFCKVCVGIYFSSALLAAAAVMALLHYRAIAHRHLPFDPMGPTEPQAGPGSPLLLVGWLGALGLAAIVPALVYVAALPDYRPYLSNCGKLEVQQEQHNALLKLPTAHPVKPVTFFEDPLCPTCRAFHERLIDEGVLENLDVTLVLFPLDSDCNWMLDRSLHPGACLLSKAVLCGGSQSRAILEWSYSEQDSLRELGKGNPTAIEKKIRERFGSDVMSCAQDKKTAVRLTQHLHYAANNHIPVSTPQMFLGDKRICDEDTDLGLKYTLSQLAPEVLR
ncbi:vitamin K epoxide reductase family protein [Pendulispora albinea]|uniref:Vitamin K epoxide reductase domain-containing protein n=1 Tax=Pendulispora albinea TaxID=2741071 RepID=A0ABZ2LPZ9_9BACT